MKIQMTEQQLDLVAHFGQNIPSALLPAFVKYVEDVLRGKLVIGDMEIVAACAAALHKIAPRRRRA